MADEIYRRITVRMWGDAKFRELSPLPPSGQSLWMVLLTGEQTDIIPGLFRIGEAAFAEQLGWSLEAFRKAFQEVSAKGMVEADWQARLVWVPNAVKHNPPQNPKVIKHWKRPWSLLPECPTKDKAWQELKGLAEAFGKGWLEAFLEVCPEPLAYQKQLAVSSDQKETTSSAFADPGPSLAKDPPAVFVPSDSIQAPREALAREARQPLELSSAPPVQPTFAIGKSGAEEVFAYWVRARKKNARTTFPEKARSAVEDRLAGRHKGKPCRKFTVAELCRAIDGVANEGWADRTKHDSLKILCRDAEQVEKFLAMEEQGTNSSQRDNPYPTPEETQAMLARKRGPPVAQ
jgi:hypothetical protein